MTEATTRVIKRYANRKLYDTLESRYVTLEQIAEMIRRGEEVKVIDNNSKDDLTSVTLAQIIFEEEKKRKSFLPLEALRNIIQTGGDSLTGLMSQLSEGAERVGHIFEKEEGEEGEEGEGAPATDADATSARHGEGSPAEASKMVRTIMDGVQTAMEDWQKRLDSNIHQALETVSPLAPLQKEIQSLYERINELESKLSRVEEPAP